MPGEEPEVIRGLAPVGLHSGPALPGRWPPHPLHLLTPAALPDALARRSRPLRAQAVAALEAAFASEGIARVRGRVSSVEPDSQSSATGHVLTANIGSQPITVTGDTLLVAIGRVPVVEGMGLAELGIDIDATTGGIAVDKALRTSVKVRRLLCIMSHPRSHELARAPHEPARAHASSSGLSPR